MVFGEIGLSGEVRAVSQMDARLKEAAKLGFSRVLMPKHRGRAAKGGDTVLQATEFERLHELTDLFGEATTIGRRAGVG